MSERGHEDAGAAERAASETPRPERNPKMGDSIRAAIALSKSGDTAGALRLLTGVVAEFPTEAAAHGYLAWFASEAGDAPRAIEHARIAVELAPSSEMASIVRFHALCDGGERLEAKAEMERFLRIRPSEEYERIREEWTAPE